MKNSFFIVLAFFAFIGCKTPSENCLHCNQPIFPAFEGGLKDSVLTIYEESIYLADSICAYRTDFKAGTYRADFKLCTDNCAYEDFYYYRGYMYRQGNKIYFLPINTRKSLLFCDFEAKINDTIPIHFVPNNFEESFVLGADSLDYSLILEKKIWDATHQDTVYKFRFYRFAIFAPVFENRQDVCLYISKKYGLMGCYTSFQDHFPPKECIYKYKGNLYFTKEDSAKIEIGKEYGFE